MAKNSKSNNFSHHCNSASIEETSSHDYILTSGRYVGIKDVEDDDEPSEEKMKRLT